MTCLSKTYIWNCSHPSFFGLFFFSFFVFFSLPFSYPCLRNQWRARKASLNLIKDDKGRNRDENNSLQIFHINMFTTLLRQRVQSTGDICVGSGGAFLTLMLVSATVVKIVSYPMTPKVLQKFDGRHVASVFLLLHILVDHCWSGQGTIELCIVKNKANVVALTIDPHILCKSSFITTTSLSFGRWYSLCIPQAGNI